MKMTFESWFAELKLVMTAAGFTEKALKTVHPKDWKSYYDSGETPASAFLEDCSNA